MRERERKRLNVSVKNKQKKSKWPSVKGKDHCFSLLLVRGFWRNKPSVLSICLGKLLRKRGLKKKITEGRKLILAPRSCSQNISGWRKRKESRVRSTYRRLGKWNIGQAKNKKKSNTLFLIQAIFVRKRNGFAKRRRRRVILSIRIAIFRSTTFFILTRNSKSANSIYHLGIMCSNVNSRETCDGKKKKKITRTES